jgi:hypothetical protein
MTTKSLSVLSKSSNWVDVTAFIKALHLQEPKLGYLEYGDHKRSHLGRHPGKGPLLVTTMFSSYFAAGNIYICCYSYGFILLSPFNGK